MKSTSATKVRDGAVYVQWEAVFEGTTAEVQELQAALAVVEKWHEATLKAVKTTESHADWTMIDLRPDGTRVIAIVKQGACG